MMVPEIEEGRPCPQLTEATPDDWLVQPHGRKQDEFLALLGHELRNPLAAIRNALQVFRRGTDDPATREWVQGVFERQTDLMGHLIEELLEFSRISHGKAHLHKCSVDLAQAVALAVETVRPSVDERGHALEISLPPGPVTLEADPTFLQQLLTNLLANAVKYTDPGGRIWLMATVEADDIVFRVRDNGIGIAPGALPHIFEPFWQVSETTGRARAGLGLGLALVRRLVEMHGGRVSAASDGTGQGSEFVLRLHRAISPETHAARTEIERFRREQHERAT